MTKEDYVRAGMSAAKMNSLTPVRVQKLFFLLDVRIPEKIGGPYFEFAPYDYGPFDKNVYSVFESLENKNLAEIRKPDFNNPQLYQLTPSGQKNGDKMFGSFPKDTQESIVEFVEWIRKHSFTQIVSTIYKHYPDMSTKSVFGK